jgi:hypothetical protein
MGRVPSDLKLACQLQSSKCGIGWHLQLSPGLLIEQHNAFQVLVFPDLIRGKVAIISPELIDILEKY